MTGKIESFTGSAMVLTNGAVSSVVAIAPHVAVTINGLKSALVDLKPGDKVEVSGDPATSVTATR